MDSISGGADALIDNPPPEIDVAALEATAPDPPPPPPAGLDMLGGNDNIAAAAEENDAITDAVDPSIRAEAQA